MKKARPGRALRAAPELMERPGGELRLISKPRSPLITSAKECLAWSWLLHDWSIVLRPI